MRLEVFIGIDLTVSRLRPYKKVAYVSDIGVTRIGEKATGSFCFTLLKKVNPFLFLSFLVSWEGGGLPG